MTSEQLRSTIESLGITQAGAARLLGVAARTMRYWLAGKREIPTASAILLRLLDRNRVTFRDVTDAK
jgi:transcriptional regulator with XRE-family HTH domain